MLGPAELLDHIACVSDHVMDGLCLWRVAELPDFHLSLILRKNVHTCNGLILMETIQMGNFSNSMFFRAEVEACSF